MTTEIHNPGNILPVYVNPLSRMHNRCGCEPFNWAIPVDYGESLATQFPVEAAPLESWDWWLLDENDEVVTELTDDYLLYSETEEGEAWISYHGDNPELNYLACGLYSLKFHNTRSGRETYYSERFRVMNIGSREKAFKLTFTHSTDVDGILYQGGYTQKAWLLDAVFDTPDVVEVAENNTDGNAVEVLAFQSVQRREVLRFPFFPDFWQGVFHRLRKHDTVTLEILILFNGQEFNLEDTGINFATEEQDVCFTKGVLSWIGSTQVMTGCETDNAMTYLNNNLIG